VSDLTTKEQANVRAALVFLHARTGRWDILAKALRVDKRTLCNPASASTAVRVARLAGVAVDDVLAGRFPDPAVCPHCGNPREP
jgi:hypothetical protein